MPHHAQTNCGLTLPPPRPPQWWYPMAFPLLLHVHAPVQAAFFATYAATLAPAACRDFNSARHGAVLVAWAARAMQHANAVFFAAHGVAAAPGRYGDGPVEGVSCWGAVVFGQVLAGLLLPTFALWHSEARLRLQWLRAQRAVAYAQRWRALASPSGGEDGTATQPVSLLHTAPIVGGSTRLLTDPFAAAGAAAALTEPGTAKASLLHAESRAYCLAGAVVVAWVLVAECVAAGTW